MSFTRFIKDRTLNRVSNKLTDKKLLIVKIETLVLTLKT